MSKEMGIKFRDSMCFRLIKHVSKESNCLRDKIGCVIYDLESESVVATGCNKIPDVFKPCYICYREENNIRSGTQYELCRSIHAEIRAMNELRSKPSINPENCILFVDRIPCCNCTKAIGDFKIGEIVYRRDGFVNPLHKELLGELNIRKYTK